MAHATGQFDPAPGDPLTVRTLPLFFAVVRLLLEGGVTVVAEAAFQDKLWKPNLERLMPLGRVRILQCHTDPATARERTRQRPPRMARADAQVIDAPHSLAGCRPVGQS